jgi:hypothetical protein
VQKIAIPHEAVIPGASVLVMTGDSVTVEVTVVVEAGSVTVVVVV